MREIKFRSWDIRNKKLILDFGAFVEECLSEGWGNPWRKPLEYKPMQFTGLKDKKGKEIYEGDIVQIVPDEKKSFANNPVPELPYGGKAKVYYDDVNAGFYLDNDADQTSLGYYAGWDGWNWLEVIGNIYENKDLLK